MSQLIQQLQQLTDREFILPTSNGTAALTLALLVDPKNGNVALPANTCFSVLSAIHASGRGAHVLDIELDRYQSLAGEIADTSSSIMVHCMGMMTDGLMWEEYTTHNNTFLIEDACLVLGGTYKNRKAGSFGKVSVLSFGYDKIVDAGGGGAFLTDDETLYTKAKAILEENKLFQMTEEVEKNVVEALAGLEESLAIRKENASYLEKYLTDRLIRKPFITQDDPLWRYSFLFRGDRDFMLKKAQEEHMIMTSHYQSLHRLRTGEDLANASYFSDHIVNVFIKPGTDKVYLDRVIEFFDRYEEPEPQGILSTII
ncbi:MAG: hypothetical protein CL843_13360 [Crocinitomicaceae bacterium]|nr:hypothetical protein [Crocinitomicaceae bacterium]